MKGARILFIDDERPLLAMMAHMIRSLGHHCDVLDNPVEALSRFQEASGGYNLVITDVNMPEMDGIELSRRLMALRPGLPVLVCTGNFDPEAKQRAMELGVREFLEKPVPRGVLARVIREVLHDTP